MGLYWMGGFLYCMADVGPYNGEYALNIRCSYRCSWPCKTISINGYIIRIGWYLDQCLQQLNYEWYKLLSQFLLFVGLKLLCRIISFAYVLPVISFAQVFHLSSYATDVRHFFTLYFESRLENWKNYTRGQLNFQ